MKTFRIMTMAAAGIFLCGPCFAQMTGAKASALFEQGSAAYKETDYPAAIRSYTDIVNGGLTSEAVFYNLGNSYMKSGDLGRAVLFYERGMALNPRDGDLLSNLRYAKSHIQTTTKGGQKNMVFRYLEDFIGFYSVNDFAVGLMIIVTMLGIIFLVKLFFGILRLFLSALFYSLVVLLIVFTAGFFFKYNASRDQAVVLDSAKARFEPLEDSTVHYELPEGVKVKWLRSEGDWAKVERADGLLGWVPQKSIERIQLGSKTADK